MAVLISSSFFVRPIHWPYSIETRELRMNLVARGSTNFLRVNNTEDADREHHSLPSSLQRKFLVSCHFTPVSLGRRMGALSGRVREGEREAECRGVALTSEGREVGKSLFLISLHLAATESLLPVANPDNNGRARASSCGCYRQDGWMGLHYRCTLNEDDTSKF